MTSTTPLTVPYIPQVYIVMMKLFQVVSKKTIESHTRKAGLPDKGGNNHTETLVDKKQNVERQFHAAQRDNYCYRSQGKILN